MIIFIQWLFIVLTILSLLIFIYLMWNFNYWENRGVRGPKLRPLTGNIPGMFTYSQHITYDLNNIYQQYKGKERFVGFFFGRQPRLLILDPKLNKEIEISNFKNFQSNDLLFEINPELDPIVSQNPVLLSGSEWKEKRADITPALTTNRIKASYPIMLDVCKKMRKFLEEKFETPPKNGFEVKDLAERYTTQVVADCVFGLEADAFIDDSILRDEGKKIFGSNVSTEMFSIFLVTTFPFISKLNRRPLVAKRTEKFFTNLMHESIKFREQSKIDRVDFLNYLIQLRDKKNLSDLQMAAHTLTFFVDGFETSSVLIAHIIHMLAKHKNACQKLREEVKDAVTKDGSLLFEKLLELPYLDCVVNETLRCFPPATFLNKVCTEPQEFTDSYGKSFVLERGICAILPMYSMQNDEQYYQDAHKFIPERFSAENGGTKKYKDMGVYFPFGDGPRQCLGMRFALTQVKAAIAELVLHWDMSINPKTGKDFVADPKSFLFVMDGGIWIDFKKIPQENTSY